MRAQRTPAPADHAPAYYANIARHTPVYVAMMRNVLEEELAGDRLVVFLGRAADLLYEAACYLCDHDARLGPLKGRLRLVDFSRRLVPSRHDEDEADAPELARLTRAYLAGEGVPAEARVLLIDAYRSAQGLTTSSLAALHGAHLTDYRVLVAADRTPDPLRDYSRRPGVDRAAVLEAARFLAHKELSPPDVYDPGREVVTRERGVEHFAQTSGKVRLLYDRDEPLQRFRNRAALHGAAVALESVAPHA